MNKKFLEDLTNIANKLHPDSNMTVQGVEAEINKKIVKDLYRTDEECLESVAKSVMNMDKDQVTRVIELFKQTVENNPEAIEELVNIRATLREKASSTVN